MLYHANVSPPGRHPARHRINKPRRKVCVVRLILVHASLTAAVNRAVEKSINKKNYQDSKVVLIADVTLGNEVELSINDELKLDHGQHSVSLSTVTGTAF